ncbi:hypothetical protein VP5_gp39 [Vibrio phage VP5]|uniref:hypothetical protein n=1 Tax=Vibrio phage VP5 TaxID=260827 RepID=UPI00003CEC5B|nr:hypothetical protein VP5_gp39 [Vibrio phage VP5]
MVTHPQEEIEMSTEIQTYGLSTVDLNELKSIEVAIREEYNKVEMTAKKAFIQMGGLLDDARRLINDDIKFGEWASEKHAFRIQRKREQSHAAAPCSERRHNQPKDAELRPRSVPPFGVERRTSISPSRRGKAD